ncbi:hypothetical protein [Streptomyces chartreusis]|uniref:hypothetical protein n=1 Tax=Streptomyces chartreusis TaxID=1969 RepID=UPI003406A1E7
MSTTIAPSQPAPGTTYPFAIADIAHATARLLGHGWSAKSTSGRWGVTGKVLGPCSTAFTFLVDEDDHLTIAFWYSTDDDFPETPKLPDGVIKCDAGVYLEHAAITDGLNPLAEQAAAAIRAITGLGDDHRKHQSAGPDQPGTNSARGEGVVYGHLPGSSGRGSSPAVADVLFGRLDR